MADKETKLSIVIRTVDWATAKINKINERLERLNERIAAVGKPFRNFGDALSKFGKTSGLNNVIDGFKGVGSAVGELVGKMFAVGGVVAGVAAGMFKLIGDLDDLGDKAEAIGVSADFLAQMRYAAERSGAAVEQLDGGLASFSKNLGQARANTGKMAKFLEKVSPALLAQLKAAKGNEQAFDLLAGAMAKLEDPAKRAALAQATLGDAALGPLFVKGPKGIKDLRDRYLELAGSQEGAAGEAGKVDDAMKDLKASTDGIKAALVEGLAPALTEIVQRLRTFFTENRARIKEWAADLGKRLPGAVSKLIDIFGSIVDAARPFVDSATKLKIIGAALAAVIAGPLISSIVALGRALIATPIGMVITAISLLSAGIVLLVRHWDEIIDALGPFGRLLRAVGGLVVSTAKLIGTIMEPVAGAIMAAWSPLKTFFEVLWSSITTIFEAAWNAIKVVVDGITDAVEAVTGVVDKIGGAITGGIDVQKLIAQEQTKQGSAASVFRPKFLDGRPDIREQAAAVIASRTAEARVTVDFANAPRGTRVQADPQNTATVDMSIGYQMLVGP